MPLPFPAIVSLLDCDDLVYTIDLQLPTSDCLPESHYIAFLIAHQNTFQEAQQIPTEFLLQIQQISRELRKNELTMIQTFNSYN